MATSSFIIARAAAAGSLALVVGAAIAQDFPSKPIRLYTTPPGGGNDFAARVIAQSLSTGMGQQVVVDNRAESLLGEILSKAPADGYTLVIAGSSFVIGHLLRKVPYHPETDFAPISLVGTIPNVVLVHPSLPVKTVKELISLAKARPGELNYASGGTGSTSHLSAELFNTMAGVKITGIPFKGSGPALTDLIGGQVQLMIGTASSSTAHIKSGRLNALAVTTAQPSVLVRGLPTVAATGLPGYEVEALLAIFVPARTPVPVVNRLNQEIVKVLNNTEIRQKFFDTGIETVGSTPDQLAGKVKTEIAMWAKVIKDAGIVAQ